jgi:3,4-dihydroxy 2-butanone 4-phosphate synthase/GTP cyclohydrolase II
MMRSDDEGTRSPASRGHGSVNAGDADVERAIEAIAAGRPVVVLADESPDGGGQLVMAADAITTDWVAFFLRHTAGLIGVALPGERLDVLGIPLVPGKGTAVDSVALAMSVDLRGLDGAGVSAEGRAATIRALCDPANEARDFNRPGSVFPLRARASGVLERLGYTESAVDLARLAGRVPAGVVCALVSADKRHLARRPELTRFAAALELPLISIRSLLAYRLTHERLLTLAAHARLPTSFGEFECFGWQHLVDGSQHVALRRGDVGGYEPVLARVHRECVAGDVLGSLVCDCRARLDQALELIAAEGRGVCVYVRARDGDLLRLHHRPGTLSGELAAELDAGPPAEAWECGIAAQILADLGVQRVRLMADSVDDHAALSHYGIEIAERVEMLPSGGIEAMGR